MELRAPGEHGVRRNMSRSSFLKTSLIIVAVAVTCVVVIQMGRPRLPLTTVTLGFPITLIMDYEAPGFITWEGRAVIAKEDYSKEHLESLFRWYKKRHPAGTGNISLEVFTDMKKASEYSAFQGVADPLNPRDDQADAHYYRDERGRISESYSYKVDLKRKWEGPVVLHGPSVSYSLR